jgi:hypothetical protein
MEVDFEKLALFKTTHARRYNVAGIKKGRFLKSEG